MKLKAVKDAIGGYRVEGTSVLWARVNECKCCWYVMDEATLETITFDNSYARAKASAFDYVMSQSKCECGSTNFASRLKSYGLETYCEDCGESND